MYDFYRSKINPDDRIATLSGVGLPDHVALDDREFIEVSAKSPEVYVDVAKTHGRARIQLFQARCVATSGQYRVSNKAPHG